jgi:hypothetical protein
MKYSLPDKIVIILPRKIAEIISILKGLHQIKAIPGKWGRESRKAGKSYG